MQTIYLTPDQVPAQLRGSYTGKQFRAYVCESMTVPSDAGLWDGGTRETYKAIDFATGRDVDVSDNMSAPWDARSDRSIKLGPRFCVVRHSIFCGKDTGLTFYVHPETAAKLLPAKVELSTVETIVLEAARFYKSSCAGRDRYQMAKMDNRYGEQNFPSRTQWDEAKTSLQAKGLLNKAGAITVAGRNAI